VTVALAACLRRRAVPAGQLDPVEQWHAEAERRGLKNLKTTPDALPELIADTSIAAFSNYDVLSEREVESRYEVLVEQYAVKLNIEAETASSIARTMILPAAVQHLAILRAAEVGELITESDGLIGELVTALGALDEANLAENQPDDEPLEWARYMRDSVIPAMTAVREVADRLEKVVADDLWPLPKYSEMLFIR